MYEIVQTGVFELAHNGGGDITGSQNWNFRWRVLLNSSHGCSIGGHLVKESERTRDKSNGFGAGRANTYDDVLSNR